MKNKIIVATGTSQHKMEFAVDYINKYCLSKGIEVEIEGVNVYTANIEAMNPDVIVLIGPNNIKINKPIILGTAFVTKLGMEATCDKIIQYLKQ
jgi:PTS system galactitol-specific IIB component